MIHLRIARDYPVAVVPEHLLGYRKRPGSMSRDTELVVQSWRKVLERLVAEGAAIDPPLHRWIEAFFHKISAEDRLGRGAYGEALLLFAGAVRRDPARWGSYALYRLIRTAVRLVRGRRPLPRALHFDAIEPTTYVSPDPDEIAPLARLLTSLEMKRVQRLRASETLQARRPTTPEASVPNI
jgi:hypothetical protein